MRETELVNRTFDLASGPLGHFELVRLEDERFLYVCLHHIISDGRSVELLLDRLAGWYEARNADVEYVPTLSAFAHWLAMRAEAPALQERCTRYWLTRRFAPRPNTFVLRGPGCASSVAEITHRFRYDRSLAGASKSLGTTPFSLGLLALMVALGYSRDAGLLIHTQRTLRVNPWLQEVTGYLANTLPLFVHPRPDQSARHAMAELDAEAMRLGQFAHQPLDASVPDSIIGEGGDRRIDLHDGIARVSFNLAGARTEYMLERTEEIALVERPSFTRLAPRPYELTFRLGLLPGAAEISLIAWTRHYDKQTCENLQHAWVRALDAIVGAPDGLVSDFRSRRARSEPYRR